MMNTDELALGIDPGTDQSGLCLFSHREQRVTYADVVSNDWIVEHLRYGGMCPRGTSLSTHLVIEMVQSYGARTLGRPLFETCVWIGRFMEAAEGNFASINRIHRGECCLHLCGKRQAKDSYMHEALRDKLGEKGTKKAPGPLFGVRSHAWQALAVAVTWVETQGSLVMLPAKEIQPCESESLVSSSSS